MQLSYLSSVLRSYWWVIAIGAILGGAAVYQATTTTADFQSDTLLLMSPNSGADNGIDPERYVNAQVSLLRSESMVGEVIDRAGSDTSVTALIQSTQVDPQPESDVVLLSVRDPDPAMAEQLANAFVDVYFERLTAEADSSRSAETAILDQAIDEAESQLASIDQQIVEVMGPFITAAQSSDSFAAIPTLEQVAPQLASSRQVLSTEINDLRSARTQLVVASPSTVTSAVIQPPTAPGSVVSRGGLTVLAVGAISGAFLALLLAAVWARLSPKVIDAQDVAEQLGAKIVGEAPKGAPFRTDGTLHQSMESSSELIQRLCVLAESAGRPDGPLTVVVAASSGTADATSLAAAMATQFFLAGLHTTLCDASTDEPRVSARMAPESTRLSEVVFPSQPLPDDQGWRDVATIAVRDSHDIEALRTVAHDPRTNTAGLGDVVVFSGGTLLNSAPLLQLAATSDVIVLAIPSHGQRKDDLAAISKALRTRKSELLPVIWGESPEKFEPSQATQQTLQPS